MEHGVGVLRNLDPLGVIGGISRSRTLQKAGLPSKKLILHKAGTAVVGGAESLLMLGECQPVAGMDLPLLQKAD